MSLCATLVALLTWVSLPQSAEAQGALVVQTCSTLPKAYTPGATRQPTVDINGNACIAGSISATTSATATNSLPTISAGAGASLYESLGGSLYVQPVFNSASGGGTQVDTTHGLPIVGISGGTAVPVSGTFYQTTQPVSIASGQVASGAFASGSIASGAIVSGADVTEGTTSPTVTCSTTWTVNGCLAQIDSDIKASLPIGSNVIGKVSIDQTTNGTTNGVVNAANTYNTIAASQSTQALTGGGGGATGDYLSHCTIVPATTAPGVVTILDNATAIYSYPGGGTTALLSLIPFSIPIAAKSVSGAWNVTTGANVSVVCVGKFT